MLCPFFIILTESVARNGYMQKGAAYTPPHIKII